MIFSCVYNHHALHKGGHHADRINQHVVKTQYPSDSKGSDILKYLYTISTLLKDEGSKVYRLANLALPIEILFSCYLYLFLR